jgi:hypothetical protein
VNAWIQDITVTIGFVVAMVIVAGIGHVYIGDAADSLKRFRDRLGRCYNRFEQPSRDLLGERAEKYRWPLAVVVWATTIAIGLLFLPDSHG